jgi:hypothetical protein
LNRKSRRQEEKINDLSVFPLSCGHRGANQATIRDFIKQKDAK